MSRNQRATKYSLEDVLPETFNPILQEESFNLGLRTQQTNNDPNNGFCYSRVSTPIDSASPNFDSLDASVLERERSALRIDQPLPEHTGLASPLSNYPHMTPLQGQQCPPTGTYPLPSNLPLSMAESELSLMRSINFLGFHGSSPLGISREILPRSVAANLLGQDAESRIGPSMATKSLSSPPPGSSTATFPVELQRKPFRCEFTGCYKSFNTGADLRRHHSGVHRFFTEDQEVFECASEACEPDSRIWSRKDNFKNHCKRVHPSEAIDDLVERSRKLAADMDAHRQGFEGASYMLKPSKSDGKPNPHSSRGKRKVKLRQSYTESNLKKSYHENETFGGDEPLYGGSPSQMTYPDINEPMESESVCPCPSCSQFFDRMEEWRSHLREEHGITSQQIPMSIQL